MAEDRRDEDVELSDEIVRRWDPERISLVSVTGNFFSVLGVDPLVGRTLRWEETWSDAPRVLPEELRKEEGTPP